METLIKCIVVASGNDASVAMAEYISGTEEAFVQQMNKRAEGLGMTGTHLCGLLRPYRGSLPCDDCQRYCSYEPGADQSVSSDPQLFNDLDGKYYSCDKTGDKGIWSFQHK